MSGTAELDPFAAAGFKPAQMPARVENLDPFAAAGFAPVPGRPEQQPGQPPTAPMPQPIGVTEFGAPIFDDSTPEGALAGRQERRGELQMGSKALQGATLGLSPYPLAAAGMLAGKPFSQGLHDVRAFNAETDKTAPTASMIAEGAGSLIPTMLTAGAVNPVTSYIARSVPRVGGLLANGLLGAGQGTLSAAGHDIGGGETENLGHDAAVGAGVGGAIGAGGTALARALQAVPNMARGLYGVGRTLLSDAGRSGVGGEVLREAGGAFPNGNARSPVPGLNLSTVQATGNPGLATLERTLGSEPGVQSGPDGGLVQNGRTPDQMSALARALVGSDAGMEPSVLVNQAGQRGTDSIRGIDQAFQDQSRALWNDPAMLVPRLAGPRIAAGLAQDVNAYPASFRDAITGPQAKLGAYLDEIHQLGPNATIPDINSVRSRLLNVARGASSGANPDPTTAAAANKMAGDLLNRVRTDPAITGSPETTNFFLTKPMPMTHVEVPDPVTIRATAPAANTNVIGGDSGASFPQQGGMPSTNQFAITKPVAVSNAVPVPIHIRASASAETPGNQAAWDAYQRARDFTRDYKTSEGYNEFSNILNPNRQGNIQGNDERMFGRFFDLHGGSSAGLQRLQGLSDFAHTMGATPQANELSQAAQQYIRAGVLNQSRAGAGINALGEPNLNPASMASTVNRSVPSVSSTPLVSPVAGDLQAAGNAAELLNRPSTLRGDMNSTTYEKLKSNDLMSAIIGQAGGSGVGALAGAYGGYKAGDATGQPLWATIPLGAAMGAAGGQAAGPMLGKALASVPLTRGIVEGPSNAIRQQIWQALRDPSVYEQMVNTPMLRGPGILDRGRVSALAEALSKNAIIPATGRDR